MKQRCAHEALTYIQPNMIVGLGGGRTVAYLAAELAHTQVPVQIVTPSYETAALCLAHHLPVLPTWSIDHVDIAFDGCDEVDEQLNALKSGGAIHTKEKIIAAMADDYVLLVDQSKVFERLPFHHPVTLEVIPEAAAHVKKQLQKLGGEVTFRTGKAKDGYTISDHGNWIMDAAFSEVNDIPALNDELNHIVGIVETSLFVGFVSFALAADETHIHKITGRTKA